MRCAVCFGLTAATPVGAAIVGAAATLGRGAVVGAAAVLGDGVVVGDAATLGGVAVAGASAAHRLGAATLKTNPETAIIDINRVMAPTPDSDVANEVRGAPAMPHARPLGASMWQRTVSE
jgi:hypothetical protein